MSEWPTKETLIVAGIVKKIYPLLAGQSPEIQGAVLADLTATWLAGHIVLGNEKGTAAIRDAMLQFQIAAVRELIPLNEAEIMGRQS